MIISADVNTVTLAPVIVIAGVDAVLSSFDTFRNDPGLTFVFNKRLTLQIHYTPGCKPPGLAIAKRA